MNDQNKNFFDFNSNNNNKNFLMNDFKDINNFKHVDNYLNIPDFSDRLKLPLIMNSSIRN